MFLKRFVSLFLLIISFLNLSTGFSFKSVKNMPSTNSVVEVSWHKGYQTKDELIADCDLIIEGKVIGNHTEIKKGIVYTKSKIKAISVKKGKISEKIISILQTGGKHNNILTQPISEAPLLEIGEKYELCLESGDFTKGKDGYYLISGGFQGVKKINAGFNADSTKGSLDNGDTPTLPYSWIENVLYVYVPTSIQSDYGYSVYDGICQGIKTWENHTNSPHTSILNSSSTSTKIFVEVDDYGANGWDAQTTTYAPDDTCVTSYIQINTYYSSSYYSMTSYWKAVTCHEFGHALGLSHNTTSGVSSIMKIYTSDYFNPLGTPQISNPCAADINSMNTKYNHNYSYQNLGLLDGHSRTCNECGYTITEGHDWNEFPTFYRCSKCNYKTNHIPVIIDGLNNIPANHIKQFNLKNFCTVIDDYTVLCYYNNKYYFVKGIPLDKIFDYLKANT